MLRADLLEHMGTSVPRYVAAVFAGNAADMTAVRMAITRAGAPDAAAEVLEAAKATVGRVIDSSLAAHQAFSAKQWDRKVAAMLDCGMGAAHRWANAPPQCRGPWAVCGWL